MSIVLDKTLSRQIWLIPLFTLNRISNVRYSNSYSATWDQCSYVPSNLGNYISSISDEQQDPTWIDECYVRAEIEYLQLLFSHQITLANFITRHKKLRVYFIGTCKNNENELLVECSSLGKTTSLILIPMVTWDRSCYAYNCFHRKQFNSWGHKRSREIRFRDHFWV